MAAKRKSAARKLSTKKKTTTKPARKAAAGPRVFATRPSKKDVLAEVARFFALLQKGDVEGAGASVAHADKDWMPHQVRSLWQDLVVPWLEERGEPADLDDGKSWKHRAWLARIGMGKKVKWDEPGPVVAEDGESFYVTVTYDGEPTDTSAEFEVVQKKGGWVLERQIIHMA
jgi:hypothetical protein